MGYPFPSLGGFNFYRYETAIYGSDTNWAKSPSYNSQRPLGSATNVSIALAIGSSERSFDVYLTQERFNALESLINTRVTFTDWKRPTPDSRVVFVTQVTPAEEGWSFKPTDRANRKIRTRVSLVTA